MFVPGNNPGMMQDAFIYGPDSIMLLSLIHIWTLPTNRVV